MNESLTFTRRDDGNLYVYRSNDSGENPSEATYPLGAVHRLTEWLHEVPPQAVKAAE